MVCCRFRNSVKYPNGRSDPRNHHDAHSLLSRQLTVTGQWANPLVALCFPHALLLIAYLIAIERGVLTYALTEKTIYLLAAAYAAFIFGVILVAVLFAKKRSLASLEEREIKLADKMVRLSLIVLAICVAAKYVILFRTFGGIYGNIIAIRAAYVTGELDYSFWNTVAFASTSFLILNLGALLGSGVKCRKQLALAFGLIVANDVTIGGANWTFSSLLLLLCTYAATKERTTGIPFSLRSIRRAAVVVSAVAVLLFSLLSFRTEGGIGSEAQPFYDIALLYAGGDIASFGYFVEHPYPSWPPGEHTFGGLYGIVNSLASPFGASFLSPMDPEFAIADPVERFNTSIHLSYYYSDFREAGVIFLSLLLGIVAMWAMVQYRKKFTLVRMQYFALFLYMAVASIRSVPTEGKYFWILLVLLPFVSRISYYIPFPRTRIVEI